MALTHRRLGGMKAFVDRMVADNGVDAKVVATTDRREALRGADYVVAMIQVGAWRASGSTTRSR
jgi:alpha-galactosidase